MIELGKHQDRIYLEPSFFVKSRAGVSTDRIRGVCASSGAGNASRTSIDAARASSEKLHPGTSGAGDRLFQFSPHVEDSFIRQRRLTLHHLPAFVLEVRDAEFEDVDEGVESVRRLAPPTAQDVLIRVLGDPKESCHQVPSRFLVEILRPRRRLMMIWIEMRRSVTAYTADVAVKSGGMSVERDVFRRCGQ